MQYFSEQLFTYMQIEKGVHRITRYSLPNFEKARKQLARGSTVMHIDVDAFYAQVEQSDYNLRGIPVIVGSWESETGAPRGIVATASYEARKFGIQTGMTHFEARQRCPYLVALRIHYEKYQAISHELHRFFQQRFPEVERYSMDELFVRISSQKQITTEQAHRIASTLQRDIRKRFSLTTSIGVSNCKTYAKLGSSLNKPAGITSLVDSESIRKQVHPLPIKTICGIGTKRANQLATLGLHTIGDAVSRGKGPFQSLFGPHLGRLIWEAAVGCEVSPVLESEPDPNEYHHIHTLPAPTRCLEQLKAELVRAIFEVCQRMRRREVCARRWEIYLRFKRQQWEGVTIPLHLREPSSSDFVVLKACWHRLCLIATRFRKLNQSFLGIGITALDPARPDQMLLHLETKPDPEELFHAMDRCNQAAGYTSTSPALLNQANRERVHFLDMA